MKLAASGSGGSASAGVSRSCSASDRRRNSSIGQPDRGSSRYSLVVLEVDDVGRAEPAGEVLGRARGRSRAASRRARSSARRRGAQRSSTRGRSWWVTHSKRARRPRGSSPGRRPRRRVTCQPTVGQVVAEVKRLDRAVDVERPEVDEHQPHRLGRAGVCRGGRIRPIANAARSRIEAGVVEGIAALELRRTSGRRTAPGRRCRRDSRRAAGGSWTTTRGRGA